MTLPSSSAYSRDASASFVPSPWSERGSLVGIGDTRFAPFRNP
jgi:hypothetical protein